MYTNPIIPNTAKSPDIRSYWENSPVSVRSRYNYKTSLISILPNSTFMVRIRLTRRASTEPTM